jgi:hypothetical protein
MQSSASSPARWCLIAMPAMGGAPLSANQAHELATYVSGLSHRQTTAAR